MNTRLASRGNEPKPLHMRKIIAVDFDGTIVKNKYPFIENPNEELIEFIKANRDKYCWILWTCRVGKQLDYALIWLREQGIEFDYINENASWLVNEYVTDSRKVYADYYIDDRNVLVRDLTSVLSGF